MKRVAAKPDAPAQRSERFVLEHTRLVKRIAHHLIARMPPSIEVETLIRAGMTGLRDVAADCEEAHWEDVTPVANVLIRRAMLDAAQRHTTRATAQPDVAAGSSRNDVGAVTS